MGRRGKFDKDKPEIIRMIQEGFDWGEIKNQFPKLPDATLSLWFKKFKGTSETSQNTSESTSEPPRLRLPIDPESPIEKVRNALWDIVHDPEGKGVAVQALNAILKSFEVEARLRTDWNEPEPSDEVSEIEVTVVDA